MKPLNWEIILSNIREAREQLEEIEREALSETPPEEVELRLGMNHAYHHLNFAWNVRHESTERYASLTQEDFERWGQYPPEIELY